MGGAGDTMVTSTQPILATPLLQPLAPRTRDSLAHLLPKAAYRPALGPKLD